MHKYLILGILFCLSGAIFAQEGRKVEMDELGNGFFSLVAEGYFPKKSSDPYHLTDIDSVETKTNTSFEFAMPFMCQTIVCPDSSTVRRWVDIPTRIVGTKQTFGKVFAFGSGFVNSQTDWRGYIYWWNDGLKAVAEVPMPEGYPIENLEVITSNYVVVSKTEFLDELVFYKYQGEWHQVK